MVKKLKVKRLKLQIANLFCQSVLSKTKTQNSFSTESLNDLLTIRLIKKALKTMDFKDDRLRIYIKLLTELIRTDEIYNPDGTFRDD